MLATCASKGLPRPKYSLTGRHDSIYAVVLARRRLAARRPFAEAFLRRRFGEDPTARSTRLRSVCKALSTLVLEDIVAFALNLSTVRFSCRFSLISLTIALLRPSTRSSPLSLLRRWRRTFTASVI
jgi:hypothetical protein